MRASDLSRTLTIASLIFTFCCGCVPRKRRNDSFLDLCVHVRRFSSTDLKRFFFSFWERLFLSRELGMGFSVFFEFLAGEKVSGCKGTTTMRVRLAMRELSVGTERGSVRNVGFLTLLLSKL